MTVRSHGHDATACAAADGEFAELFLQLRHARLHLLQLFHHVLIDVGHGVSSLRTAAGRGRVSLSRLAQPSRSHAAPRKRLKDGLGGVAHGARAPWTEAVRDAPRGYPPSPQ